MELNCNIIVSCIKKKQNYDLFHKKKKHRNKTQQIERLNK